MAILISISVGAINCGGRTTADQKTLCDFTDVNACANSGENCAWLTPADSHYAPGCFRFEPVQCSHDSDCRPGHLCTEYDLFSEEHDIEVFMVCSK